MSGISRIVSEEQLHWAIVVMTEDVEKGKDLPCFQVYDRIYDDAGGKWWYLFSQNVLLGETHRCLGGAYVGTVKECQVGSLKEVISSNPGGECHDSVTIESLPLPSP